MYPEEYTPLRGERFHGGYFSQPGSWQELSLRALVTFSGCSGNVVAGGIGQFFMGFAYFAEGVVPAVVPVDAGFVALNGPDAMACAQSSAGLADGFERDPEGVAAAVANLPLAEKISR